MIQDMPFFSEALVVSNKDPKGRERLLIKVPGIHPMDIDLDANAIWANHCAPTKQQSGGLPEKGDWVYVMFPKNLEPMFCIWLGVVRFNFQKDDFSKTLAAEAHNEYEEESDLTEEYTPTEL